MNNTLPDSEYRIMSIIWEAEAALNSSDIMKMLVEENWKAPTVCSYLQRLENKGFVVSQKLGKERRYTAAITKEEYLASETQSFMSEVHKGSFASLINALISTKSISMEDIEALQLQLEKLKEEE